MKKLSILFIFFPLLLSAQPDSVYFHFNNYDEGDLNGQDSWQTINQTNGPSDLIVGVAAGNVATVDGTNGIYYNSGGAGFGRTATQKNFGDFELNLSNGGVLEIEAELHLNYWGEFIGLGFDEDEDGNIAPGLNSEPNDGGFILAMASVNFPNGNNLITPDGNSHNFNFDNSGWIKYKMWIDLDANGGAGQIALFYKTPPFDGDWIAVSDIQGINLGLTPGSGDKNDPNMWNGFFYHAQGGTGFLDNLIIRRPGGSTLNSQFIDFPEIEKQLTNNISLDLNATADSGLPVSFEILSGPATLNGNTLTFSGAEGIIEVQANQAGDGTTWAPASPVIRSFEVIDPFLYFPNVTVRNPVDDNKVLMPELSPFMIVVEAAIDHPDVLSIGSISFNIGSETIEVKDWGTGYYTGWWTPTSFGDHVLVVEVQSSEGPNNVQAINFEVDNIIDNQSITILDGVRAGTLDSNIVFPSFIGAYENVKIILNYDCPPEGCEPWDRINQQEVQGPTGEWIGFMRYITPYGVACSDEQDITDYMSLFQGLVHVKFPYEYRSLITLTLEYTAGTPEYKYSWVDEVWDNTYSFGDMENLQPVPLRNIDLADEVEDARLKIINSGHNWGENNSGNAAEFYEADHQVKVNGGNTFTQHLWETCNPNPADCSPQNGTWFHNRAGWCPGALVDFWDFELDDFVPNGGFDLEYQFDSGYTDFCHPSNPNCVSGSTCPDCANLSNPILVVDAHLVSFSNMPIEGIITNTEEPFVDYNLSIIPNPSNGSLTVLTTERLEDVNYRIINALGQIVDQGNWEDFSNQKNLDLRHLSKGMYWFILNSKKGIDTERIIIQSN